MTDFLDSLVDRSLGTGPVLLPRVASRFEPQQALAGSGLNTFRQPDLLSERSDLEVDAPSPRLDVVNSQPGPIGVSAPAADQPGSSLLMQTGALSEGLNETAPLPNRYSNSDPAPFDSAGATRVTTAAVRHDAHLDAAWLHRRLDDLSQQLQRWRGVGGDDQPRPVGVHPIHQEAFQAPVPKRLDGARNESLPAGSVAEAVRELSEKHSTSPPPHRTIAPLIDVKDFEGALEPQSLKPQLFAIDGPRESVGRPEPSRESNDASRHSPPKTAIPQIDVARERATPRDRRRESHEELLALLSGSNLRSAPKITVEDLPGISKHSAPPQPTVNVTIGRIEVKATQEPAAAPRPARAQGQSSVMSLQDYLQQRAAGGGR